MITPFQGMCVQRFITSSDDIHTRTYESMESALLLPSSAVLNRLHFMPQFLYLSNTPLLFSSKKESTTLIFWALLIQDQTSEPWWYRIKCQCEWKHFVNWKDGYSCHLLQRRLPPKAYPIPFSQSLRAVLPLCNWRKDVPHPNTSPSNTWGLPGRYFCFFLL